MKLSENSYYKELHQKVMQFDYTIISLVDEEPKVNHASYCYTIGLSNYNHPELLFIDCYYDDVITAVEHILANIKLKQSTLPGDTIFLKETNKQIKAIKLKDGAKEELTKQATYYFELYRQKNQEYELLYISQQDECGYDNKKKKKQPKKKIKKQN